MVNRAFLQKSNQIPKRHISVENLLIKQIVKAGYPLNAVVLLLL
jgi:hypothetical protein